VKQAAVDLRRLALDAARNSCPGGSDLLAAGEISSLCGIELSATAKNCCYYLPSALARPMDYVRHWLAKVFPDRRPAGQSPAWSLPPPAPRPCFGLEHSPQPYPERSVRSVPEGQKNRGASPPRRPASSGDRGSTVEAAAVSRSTGREDPRHGLVHELACVSVRSAVPPPPEPARPWKSSNPASFLTPPPVTPGPPRAGHDQLRADGTVLGQNTAADYQ